MDTGNQSGIVPTNLDAENRPDASQESIDPIVPTKNGEQHEGPSDDSQENHVDDDQSTSDQMITVDKQQSPTTSQLNGFLDGSDQSAVNSTAVPSTLEPVYPVNCDDDESHEPTASDDMVRENPSTSPTNQSLTNTVDSGLELAASELQNPTADGDENPENIDNGLANNTDDAKDEEHEPITEESEISEPVTVNGDAGEKSGEPATSSELGAKSRTANSNHSMIRNYKKHLRVRRQIHGGLGSDYITADDIVLPKARTVRSKSNQSTSSNDVAGSITESSASSQNQPASSSTASHDNLHAPGPSHRQSVSNAHSKASASAGPRATSLTSFENQIENMNVDSIVNAPDLSLFSTDALKKASKLLAAQIRNLTKPKPDHIETIESVEFLCFEDQSDLNHFAYFQVKETCDRMIKERKASTTFVSTSSQVTTGASKATSNKNVPKNPIRARRQQTTVPFREQFTYSMDFLDDESFGAQYYDDFMDTDEQFDETPQPHHRKSIPAASSSNSNHTVTSTSNLVSKKPHYKPIQNGVLRPKVTGGTSRGPVIPPPLHVKRPSYQGRSEGGNPPKRIRAIYRNAVNAMSSNQQQQAASSASQPQRHIAREGHQHMRPHHLQNGHVQNLPDFQNDQQMEPMEEEYSPQTVRVFDGDLPEMLFTIPSDTQTDRNELFKSFMKIVHKIYARTRQVQQENIKKRFRTNLTKPINAAEAMAEIRRHIRPPIRPQTQQLPQQQVPRTLAQALKGQRVQQIQKTPQPQAAIQQPKPMQVVNQQLNPGTARFVTLSATSVNNVAAAAMAAAGAAAKSGTPIQIRPQAGNLPRKLILTPITMPGQVVNSKVITPVNNITPVRATLPGTTVVKKIIPSMASTPSSAILNVANGATSITVPGTPISRIVFSTAVTNTSTPSSSTTPTATIVKPAAGSIVAASTPATATPAAGPATAAVNAGIGHIKLVPSQPGQPQPFIVRAQNNAAGGAKIYILKRPVGPNQQATLVPVAPGTTPPAGAMFQKIQLSSTK